MEIICTITGTYPNPEPMKNRIFNTDIVKKTGAFGITSIIDDYNSNELIKVKYLAIVILVVGVTIVTAIYLTTVFG